jgi:hypothetical protein
VRPQSSYAKCNALIKETGKDVAGDDVMPPTRPQPHRPTTRSPSRARLCPRVPHAHGLNSDTPAHVAGPFGPARGLRGCGGRVWPARAARGRERLLTSGWQQPLYGSEWGPAFPAGLDTGGVCESNKADVLIDISLGAHSQRSLAATPPLRSGTLRPRAAFVLSSSPYPRSRAVGSPAAYRHRTAFSCPPA